MKTPLILSFQFMTDQTFLQVLENDSGLTNITATCDWLKENKQSIELKLEEYGAILFKDLPIETIQDFDQFVSTFKYDTFTYKESLSNAVRINKTNKVCDKLDFEFKRLMDNSEMGNSFKVLVVSCL